MAKAFFTYRKIVPEFGKSVFIYRKVVSEYGKSVLDLGEHYTAPYKSIAST